MFTTLRFRFYLILIAASIPATVLLIDATRREDALAREAAGARLAAAVRAVAAPYGDLLARGHRALESASASPPVRAGDAARASALFAEILAAHPAWLNVGLADVRGDALATAAAAGRPFNLAERAFPVESLARNSSLAAGGWHIDPDHGEPAIIIGHAVVDEAGRRAGVLFASVAIGRVVRPTWPEDYPAETRAFILDREGVILQQWRRPDAPGAAGAPFPWRDRLDGALRGGESVTLVTDTNGADLLLAGVTLADESTGVGPAWLLAAITTPAAAVYAPVERHLARNLLWLALATAVALAVVTLLGEILVTRPARALQRAAERLGRGDFSARSGVQAAGGEFGVLACSFDAMAREIENRQRESARLVAQLEDCNADMGADLAARKRAEEELRATQAQLVQAQKMEAVGRLAGGIAHDFNNFLTVISGYGQLLAAGVPKDNPAAHHVREILQAGERAASLTRQLLAFSRRQILRPAVIDLNQVIGAMNDMITRLIGEDLTLRMRLAPGLWPVLADPGQVEQVILNLGVNARDAMPEGGEIFIETRNAHFDATFRRPEVQVKPGDYAEFVVRDTGLGMTDEVKHHLFEPFFTTKPVGKGTGLGLSTVYGIVKQSGGYIWIDSQAGTGTTVTVVLPRVAAPLPQPAPPSASAPGTVSAAPPSETDKPPRGDGTILLVEDDDAVRVMVEEVLGEGGYGVLTARDGQEALTLLRNAAGPVRLLLTDVVMPGMTGVELLQRASSIRPDLRALLVSGYTDQSLRERGEIDPSVAFLHKPFSPDALLRKVREVLASPPAGS
ncbi:MAG: response regulator [Planctomycetes bacterium]|nr:response regulator [Planctomycetota bacterium]